MQKLKPKSFKTQILPRIKSCSLLLIMAALPLWSFSQAEVFSDGSVLLAEKLNISTNCEVYPDQNNTGYIGIYGQQFFEIRGQYHYSGSNPITSDTRWKENFRKLEQPLEKVLLFNGHKYNFKLNETDFLGTQKEVAKKAKLKKDKLGFIAQEIADIFPEAVVFENEIDQYSLDYFAILTLSVEAFKKQQAQLTELNEQLERLKKNLQ